MNILVLGGSRFVGLAIVEAALAAGHQVTTLNRGQTAAPDMPKVRRLFGDRGAGDVAALREDEWDAVVDVSAYRPAEVRPVLDALGDSRSHYLYISTVSVYRDPVSRGADEAAPLIEVPEDISGSDPEAYGGLKVLCEKELRAALSERLTILRPTIVIGPRDYTDRFTWWVRSIAKGGRLEVPRRLDQPLQLVDMDDLARFAVHTLEERITGTFNVVGPEQPMTLGGMIDVVRDALEADVTLLPSDDAAVTSLPLTLPPRYESDGVFAVSNAAALRNGLRLRPLAELTRAVHAWDREQAAATR